METKKQRSLQIKILTDTEATKVAAGLSETLEDGEYHGEYMTFTSQGNFFEVFNARRCDIIVKLQALGKSSIRALAKQVGRDMRRVHDDVKVLISHGIIEQDSKGVSVPYKTIKADFTLRAAT